MRHFAKGVPAPSKQCAHVPGKNIFQVIYVAPGVLSGLWKAVSGSAIIGSGTDVTGDRRFASEGYLWWRSCFLQHASQLDAEQRCSDARTPAYIPHLSSSSSQVFFLFRTMTCLIIRHKGRMHSERVRGSVSY